MTLFGTGRRAVCLRGDENMCQALLEIMEPEINKIKA